jgi:hypothetical protein
MVHVPERFKGLLPDTMVRRRVHEEHAQKHHMARDATGLCVVDLESRHRANLGLLDVEEAAQN